VSVDDAMHISPGVQEKLSRLGIRTEWDLILHLPIRYEDETHLFPIADAPAGQIVQVEGVIIHNEVVTRPRRQLVCQIEDGSGVLVMRYLNFYGSQIKTYAVGRRVRLLGEIRHGYHGMEMVHPKCRIVSVSEPLADTMTPVYPVTAGLPQKTLVKLIGQTLQNAGQTKMLTETVPDTVIKHYQLAGFSASVINLHHPAPDISIGSLQNRTHPSWRRIKFDELLAQQLSMRLHYRQRRQCSAPVLAPKNQSAAELLERLAFRLTAAQIRVFDEISRDLAAPYPMQRLLQGDVGSGKTIVAALAALQAIENGFQAAIMVPTEILATNSISASCPHGLTPWEYELPGYREVRKRNKSRKRWMKFQPGWRKWPWELMHCFKTRCCFSNWDSPLSTNSTGLVCSNAWHYG
jgi:ATP-dependent DNA helicase RecG